MQRMPYLVELGLALFLLILALLGVFYLCRELGIVIVERWPDFLR